MLRGKTKKRLISSNTRNVRIASTLEANAWEKIMFANTYFITRVAIRQVQFVALKYNNIKRPDSSVLGTG